MTELAIKTIDDGQVMRAFYYYFSETYDSLKGKEFEFEGITFNDPLSFYEFIKDVADYHIQIIKEETTPGII